MCRSSASISVPPSLCHGFLHCLLTCFCKNDLHQLLCPPPGGDLTVLSASTASIRESTTFSPKALVLRTFTFHTHSSKNRCELTCSLNLFQGKLHSHASISDCSGTSRAGLDTLRVPELGGVALCCHSPFLRASLPLPETLESSSGPVSCSATSSQLLLGDELHLCQGCDVLMNISS